MAGLGYQSAANSQRKLTVEGWLVAKWLKHSTANRKVAGSNPTIAIGDFLSLLGVRLSNK